ncbi:UNVERIFIED_CONTAM: hypothetical protein Sangu_1292500 [Sesamum angustifolium]|uniref:Surfeit locus protein 2 n=1 Tax=Sesamum angustifolium TaxID=2727405 RepID=A0AAW2NNA0_9LAMI
MGKKKGGETHTPSEQREGHNLLGSPTFEQLENGRYKCVETGHELPAHARDSYAESKHCRLGLIDAALAGKKPPLNMFRQDPASRNANGTTGKQDKGKEKKKKKKNEGGGLEKKIEKEEEHVDEIINEVRDSTGKSSDSETEADFWMPPVGECWDHDDGGDRWGSGSESGPESDDAGDEDLGAEETNHETGDLSKRTKRMSLEIGPSSFASRKKKKKTNVA